VEAAMASESDAGMSDPVDLGKDLYVGGRDFQLLCCASGGGSSGGGGSTDTWLTAAELVYEFTGNPGSIIRNMITFTLNDRDRIEMDLLDGKFWLHLAENAEVLNGRKAIELLMYWKRMSFVEAIEFVATRYSPDQALMLGNDFVRMKIMQYLRRTQVN
jgi:hypothetical protein